MPSFSPATVFFGTPEFAVESLKAIIEAGHTVAGVVTTPDKPAGRGRMLQVSPVKKYAEKQNLKILQPLSLKDTLFLKELGDLKADLFVVVAFRMLPAEVWKMPALGTFNLHASLLPQYRGAAPINWAIINGEKKTGITTFFINEEIDKGTVLFMEETPITENDTAGTLHDRLMIMGSKLTVKTIEAIFKRNCRPVSQSLLHQTGPLKTAPKIFREDCRIDWNKPVKDIYNLVRGLDPAPGAWTILGKNKGEEGYNIKIFSCSPVISRHNNLPGSVVKEGNSLLSATCDGYLRIMSIQMEGKKKMETGDFLRGFKFGDSWKFL